MWYDNPHVLALAMTASVCLGVCLFLHPYLLRILRQYSGDGSRGRFWTAIAELLLVLVPATTILVLCRPIDFAHQPFIYTVMESLSRGFLGLVGCVVLLTVVIGFFGQVHGSTVVIDAEESEDLSRMLLRIRELRARELIRKIDSKNERIDLNDPLDRLATYPRYSVPDHDPTNGNF